jgi:hypothetical protein
MRIFETLIAICVVLFGTVAGLGLAMALIHAQDTPHLSHRPATGNHGQGAMIDARHCPPGAFPYYTDEGLFLTCMRGSP